MSHDSTHLFQIDWEKLNLQLLATRLLTIARNSP